MSYAITKPNGEFHRVVVESLPAGTTHAQLGVLPVNETVPEGYRRTGWQIIDGVCEPALEALEVLPSPEPTPLAPVTRRQLFLWLNANLGLSRAYLRGRLEEIADPSAREAALIEFDEAATFERTHPLIDRLASALELTSEQVDAAFIAAAQIE